MGAWVLISKANIGLGVLSLPYALHILGLVPGLILLVTIALIIAYCAAQVGSFKLRHPEVYDLADGGLVVGGRPLKEILYFFFYLYMITMVSSAIVSVSTALNAVSAHGACTAVFIVVAAIMGLLLGSIRTLDKVSIVGWAGLVSLAAALLILTIAVGLQDRPPDAPKLGPWDKDLHVVAQPSFAKAMSAIASIVFSFGSTATYWNVASEMRNPRSYKKAMLWSVGIITVVYCVIGGVVYGYCGRYVASPALGSAGPLLKKICYGIAIPALVGSLTIYGHLAGKHIFIRLLKGTRHLTSNSRVHWTTWLSCMFAGTVISYIIASAVPNFGSIISLVGAFVCPTVAIWPYNLMWWHDNWRYASPERRRSWRVRAELALNIFLFVLAFFLTVGGTYGAVMDVIQSSSDGGPWSCNDNSHSV